MTTFLIISGVIVLIIIIIAIAKPKKKTVGSELNKLIAEMHKQIFPNGQSDIDAGINELLRILSNSIDRKTAQSIFMKSSIICYTTSMDSSFSKERLKQHLAPYAMQYFNENSVTKFYEYLLSKNAKAALFDVAYTAQQGQSGTDQNEIPAGYGEFGLDRTNPIPVCGIPMGYMYLSKLRLFNGTIVTYKRIGSMRAPNFSEIIDGYSIFANGNKIATIYLAPYNKNTSTKAPKGLKLV